jgi:hydrogenase maturation protease
MAHTLIIGYGNTLRSDDGAGFRVAEALRARILDPGIEIRAEHQLLPELMADLAEVRRAIFIDATPSPHGRRFHRIPLRAGPACSRFTHHATPESLLAGALRLYGHAPDAALYTIPARAFETGETISAVTRQAMDDLIAVLEREFSAATTT